MSFVDGLIILCGCVLSGLLVLVEHWFRWERFLGRELHKLEAYTIGTASIYVGFFLVCFLTGDLKPAWQLAIVIIASGLSVYGAWYVDHIGLKWAITRRKAKKNDLGESHSE